VTAVIVAAAVASVAHGPWQLTVPARREQSVPDQGGGLARLAGFEPAAGCLEGRSGGYCYQWVPSSDARLLVPQRP